jgi:hypothetical protein
MQTNRIFCIVIILCTQFLWEGCRKEEEIYNFPIRQLPKPATERDTAVSVHALLNGSKFEALGRANYPDSTISISFFDFNSEAFLEFELNADTIGTYTLGRKVSEYTAVYYKSILDKRSSKGFTSRATEDAGGSITILKIDSVDHKIKGTFTLSLQSRSDSSKFIFTDGSFDFFYNYCEMKLDNNVMNGKKQFISSEGSTVSPEPQIMVDFQDSVSLKISLVATGYKGIGQYDVKDAEDINFIDNRNNKTYKAISGKFNLLRYNFGEFLQATFSCELQADDGEKKTITDASLVIGNME